MQPTVSNPKGGLRLCTLRTVGNNTGNNAGRLKASAESEQFNQYAEQNNNSQHKKNGRLDKAFLSGSG
jgi:hypothetical protein